MESKNKSLNLPILILAVLLAIALLGFYWPVLNKWIVFLANSEDYSFGLLLPVVSAYIIYLKWPKIRQESWNPSWLGLAILALGFSIYLVGELAADPFIPRLSFVLVITGVVCLFGGIKNVRLLGFPLLLLVFMIPLPGMVTKSLTLPLQLMSSSLAAGFLRAMGVRLTLQGNVIDLGVRQLQVVAACSGLRYIFALLALGIIFCYFFQRRIWKAAILLISLIPVAIIANALRVAAMGLFPSLEQGFWHGFSGRLIILFCLGFLGLFNWLLNYLFPSLSAPIPIIDSTPVATVMPLNIKQPSYMPYLISALALTFMVGPLAMQLGHVSKTPILQSFSNFPMKLGSWQGHFVSIDPEVVKRVGSDAHLKAEFQDSQHPVVTLWIAYYESQSKSAGSIHSPKYCLAGGGWNTLESGKRHVEPGHPVQYMLMEQAGARMIVYYWYIQGGRWVANEYARKFFTGYDGLVSRRNDGALIRLITPVAHDPAAALERMDSFVKLLIPILPQYIQR